MQRIVQFVVALVLLLLVFTGCATQVAVERLIPAKYSMADYRELTLLAVKPYRFFLNEAPSYVVKDLSGNAPFKVFSGYGNFFERELANNLDRELRNKLALRDYFLLTESSREAYLDVEVKRLEVEEYIWARKETSDEGQEETLYNLQQKLLLEVAFQVVDVKTGRTVYSDAYYRRKEFSYALDTEKGPTIYAPSLSHSLLEMGKELIGEVADALTPRREIVTFSLMSNKPKIERLEEAYKAVEEGRLNYAYDLFLSEFRRSGQVAAGYNAALIMEAQQNRAEAIDLMRQVYHQSASAKVKRQLDRMIRYQAEQGEAERQF